VRAKTWLDTDVTVARLLTARIVKQSALTLGHV